MSKAPVHGALQVIPSVDLRGGRVVRLAQGDYSRQISYDVDPIATALSYREAGARWFHLVDLDGAKEGRPVQTELIGKIIAACLQSQNGAAHDAMQIEVGGGVRNTADIERLLNAGASRVVVGTRAMEAWEWFEEMVHQPQFAEKIVLALDAKNGVIATRGWTESADRLAVDVAKNVSNWPLGAILYTDVAKDGMMSGPNIQQTCKLAEAGSVPVIASGGVGSIEHIQQLTNLPIWGVIVGRSLYEGTLDLRQAIAVAHGNDRGAKAANLPRS